MSDQILALDRTQGLTDGQFTFSERVNYLKQFGVHSQSFSTLQPGGMQYFDVEGMGYVATCVNGGAAPLCCQTRFAHPRTSR